MKGVMKQPLAKLSRQVTDRASNTKTHASQPRTFEQVLAWDTFWCEAVRRFQALDDTDQKYSPQVRHFCGHFPAMFERLSVQHG